LSDGKDPTFEEWLLLVEQKLSANKDHFDTPELRIAYVVSRSKQRARRYIIPRLRTDAVNKYQDAQEILDHLKSIYNDPNWTINAQNQFRRLSMKTSDEFHDFYSEFLYLAAEANVPEESWKEELYQKLTIKLQQLTIPEAVNTNGTFQQFSDYCSQTANRLEMIIARNRRIRPRTKTADVNLHKYNPRAVSRNSDSRNRLISEKERSNCLQIEHPERNENHNEVEEIIRDPAKRAGLREVSTLSIKRIEPKELNLHSLLGRESESFTITYKIVQNGYSVAINTLVDTGANGFVFLDAHLALLIARFFKTRTIPLKNPCAVRGYDGKSETPITHAMILNLIVDGRRQLHLPMLIVNLGRHDLILGRKWLATFEVLPDCRRNRLLWPD